MTGWIVVGLMAGLPQKRLAEENPWFLTQRPYVWEAEGRQLRMHAIMLALSTLYSRPEKDARILVQSRIDRDGVTVRLSLADSKKTPLLLQRYRPPMYVAPPRDHMQNAFTRAAAGFHATASYSLSDLDPRWTSFTLDVYTPEENIVYVLVLGHTHGLKYGLSRAVVMTKEGYGELPRCGLN